MIRQLLLPVENQVRELDAKLLLASVAALQGLPSVIGWKGLIERRLARYPRGIYLAKSVTNRNLRVLKILNLLGHSVVASDEEALVHYPPSIYYHRRLGRNALELVDHLVAWGEDNAALLRGYAGLPPGKPIHVLGNPRVDLLRPEFRPFFQADVRRLKEEHGDFVLINTNFGSINGYYPKLNLMYPNPDVPGAYCFGVGAESMPEEYASGLFRHRTAVFQAFQQLVLELAKALPQTRFILRPHPAENQAFWEKHLADLGNVSVVGKGNVVPWLLAAQCVIHNGCTTAIEAFVLDKPVISYVPLHDDRYEFSFPDEMGKKCKEFDEVLEAVTAHAIHGMPPEKTPERSLLIKEHICSLEGRLASEKIVDLVREIDAGNGRRSPLLDRLKGIYTAERRALSKVVRIRLGTDRYSESFMRQRFPAVSRQTVQDKADRLVSLLGSRDRVVITQDTRDSFVVSHA